MNPGSSKAPPCRDRASIRAIAQTLLKISLRGGLKLGPAIITIALFTALAVSVSSMAVAYTAEGSVIVQFAPPPQFSVSAVPTNCSVAVGISSVEIDGLAVSVYSTSSPASLLGILGTKPEGSYPPAGGALVGKSLSPHVDAGRITIAGSTYNVSGYLSSYLAYTVILNQAPSGESLYFARFDQSASAPASADASAPSFSALVAAVADEALAPVRWLVALLLALLAVVCTAQGYRAINDCSSVAVSIGSLSPSRVAVVSSSAAIAAAIALACASLGCAMGLFSSAFLSAALSSAFSLPHLKPAVDAGIVLTLMLSFATSAASLGSGLAFGCVSALGPSGGVRRTAQGAHP